MSKPTEPLTPEVVEPETEDGELNEYGFPPSDVLIITGFDEQATVTPYQCDNCRVEFKCDLTADEIDYCPVCGKRLINVDDEF